MNAELDDTMVGTWARRNASRPAHYVNSVVADSITTACGREMRHVKGRRLQFDRDLFADRVGEDCVICSRIIARRTRKT